MTFSFTGLAYLLGFLGTGLLTYRFFQYWQREKTVISKFLLFFTGFIALFLLVGAIGGLFFAKNLQVLIGVVIVSAILQSLAFASAGYVVAFLKIPKVKPYFVFIVILFLGLVATALTALTPFYPYLDQTGSINWNTPFRWTDILRLSLFLITFVPLMIIFVQQYKTSKDAHIKAKALGLSAGLLFGLFVALLDFLLKGLLKLGPQSSDIAMGVLGVCLLVILLSQKSLPPIEKEYTSPKYPQIQW